MSEITNNDCITGYKRNREHEGFCSHYICRGKEKKVLDCIKCGASFCFDHMGGVGFAKTECWRCLLIEQEIRKNESEYFRMISDIITNETKPQLEKLEEIGSIVALANTTKKNQ